MVQRIKSPSLSRTAQSLGALAYRSLAIMGPVPDTSQPWFTLMSSGSMTARSVRTLAATMAKYSLTRPVSTWSKYVVPCTANAEVPTRSGADALPAQRAGGGNDIVLFNVLRRITPGINNGMICKIHVLGNCDYQGSAAASGNFLRQNKSLPIHCLYDTQALFHWSPPGSVTKSDTCSGPFPGARLLQQPQATLSLPHCTSAPRPLSGSSIPMAYIPRGGLCGSRTSVASRRFIPDSLGYHSQP